MRIWGQYYPTQQLSISFEKLCSLSKLWILYNKSRDGLYYLVSLVNLSNSRYFCLYSFNAEMNKKRLILSQPLLDVILARLSQEIIENNGDMKEAVIIGLQPRGVFLAERIVANLKQTLNFEVPYGVLDATFYRDDFRRRDSMLTPNSTRIDFVIENKKVILIDDVLATGRMVRAAIDALQAFGRPNKIELLCLIDRSYSRDLPIQPDYVGRRVNTQKTQRVLVEWTNQGYKADKIWLMD